MPTWSALLMETQAVLTGLVTQLILAEWGRQRFGGVDVPAERRLADLVNRWRWFRRTGNCSLARAAARYSAARETRIEVGAGGVAPPAIGGAQQLGHGQRQDAAFDAGVRGFALDRSDYARRATQRCRARRLGAALHPG